MSQNGGNCDPPDNAEVLEEIEGFFGCKFNFNGDRDGANWCLDASSSQEQPEFDLSATLTMTWYLTMARSGTSITVFDKMLTMIITQCPNSLQELVRKVARAASSSSVHTKTVVALKMGILTLSSFQKANIVIQATTVSLDFVITKACSFLLRGCAPFEGSIPSGLNSPIHLASLYFF